MAVPLRQSTNRNGLGRVAVVAAMFGVCAPGALVPVAASERPAAAPAEALVSGAKASFAGRSRSARTTTVASRRTHPVVSVAGDIACGPGVRAYNGGNGTSTQCRQKYTAPLIRDSNAVWTLGDHAYPVATLSALRTGYHPTWGRKKAVTYPTPGDHDYGSNRGKDYFRYFGRRPYYTFKMGGWRVFSLNSEIDHRAKSPQVRWLKRQLAATRTDCIAAYWGTPRWTSGPKAPGHRSVAPFWKALYARRADLALSGDTHNYERFAPRKPAGAPAANGIRQFVVGTGGRSLIGFPHVQRTSQVRKQAFGVLRLRLHPHSYNWRFIDQKRRTLDSGFNRCNPRIPG